MTLGLMLVAAPAGTRADALIDALKSCSVTTPDRARLNCYDALAKGVESPGSGGAASESSSGIVEEYVGADIRTMRPFRVNGPWEVQWNFEGDILQIMVYSKNGTLRAVAANQEGSGTGSAYQPSAGDYYLSVNSTGRWRIRVVSVQ